jgi:catechol 2,3-dioxygenase-like lactoylglutathione lyase family enzyme
MPPTRSDIPRQELNMNKKVDPIPAGRHTLTPTITVKNAAKAIEFYKKAFGAVLVEEPCAMPDGRIGHAELKIGDSILMLNDEFPEMGCAARSARRSSSRSRTSSGATAWARSRTPSATSGLWRRTSRT